MTGATWFSLGGEELPPPLVAMLDEVAAGQDPAGAKVFRASGAKAARVPMVLLSLGGVAFLVAVAAFGLDFAPVAMLAAIVAAALLIPGLAIWADTDSAEGQFLLLHPDYIAYGGDPDGVQWTDTRDIDTCCGHLATQASGGQGGGSGGSSPYLEVVYRGQRLALRIFLSEAIEGSPPEYQDAAIEIIQPGRVTA